jgi:hypothetical protein
MIVEYRFQPLGVRVSSGVRGLSGFYLSRWSRAPFWYGRPPVSRMGEIEFFRTACSIVLSANGGSSEPCTAVPLQATYGASGS